MRKLTPRLATGAAILGAAVGGAAIASAATTSSSSSTSATTSAPARAHAAFPPPGASAHENAEKTVTGTAADKARAAAVKAVGGGTAGAVTTDFMGSGYETTVTKSDGSKVEVHLDSSLRVMQGRGGHHGGPGCPGGPGAPSGQGAVGAPSGQLVPGATGE